MKTIKEQKYVICKVSKTTKTSEPQMIVQNVSKAIMWCGKLNALQEELGLNELYEYDWNPADEYIEINEGEE